MRTIRFVCFGVLLIPVSFLVAQENDILLDEFAPAIARQVPADDLLYPDPVKCAGGRWFVCVGCRTIKICLGQANDNDNPTQICPVDSPYCNTAEGSCSTIPDDSQEQCSVQAATQLKLRCTSRGQFPDPRTCDGYYFCEQSGSFGDPYKCPPKYTYNSRLQLCKRRGSKRCNTVNCTSNNSILTAYPSNPQYFYYCPKDVGKDPLPIMFSCGDRATFDSSAKKCVYKCPRQGLFVKSNNPNMYYQCYRSNGRLTYSEKFCPAANQVFDNDKKVCVVPGVSYRPRFSFIVVVRG
ncbi:uncharacterized protein LOC131687109 [Topomyia yanbarensis]|uniref:uncharacterized protein LOC131687109 n=1 Tax=Topomyia yanbarensis TaxID=2498891 RepID=UPI00273AE063|nr:uncharacterized protein LOC131687109 [Topomyia yanbarensis]